MARYIYQGVEPTTKNTSTWQDSHSDLTELARQAKVKRIQNHQTSFITNAKGTSLGSKQNKKIKDLQKINPKQLTNWSLEHIYQ